jgi:hypothetical protein
VYDIRPQQGADTATGTIAETDEQFAQRLTASANYALTFTLYLGSETQEPDPTIESVEGIGQVQPFLGLSYIVYQNRLLETSQGWRHPNFQFEVFENGTGDCVTKTLTGQETLFPFNYPATSKVRSIEDTPLNPLNLTTYSWQAAGAGFNIPATFDTPDAALAYGTTQNGGHDYIKPPTGWGFSNDWGQPMASDPDWVNPDSDNTSLDYAVFFNSIAWVGEPVYEVWDEDAGLETLDEFLVRHGAGPGVYIWWNGLFLSTIIRHSGHGCYDSSATFHPDDTLSVIRSPAAPAPPCLGLPDAPIDGYCVGDDGAFIQKTDWVKQTVTGAPFFNALSQFQFAGGGGLTVTQLPLGPVVVPTDPNYDLESFWVAAYNAAVAAGTMPPGKVFNVHYPVQQLFAWTLDSVVCQSQGSEVKVSEIIRSVCSRAGVANIDVTDMELISVNGYPVSSMSSAASILDPLKSVAFFDAVESGITIRFQSRGKDIVATLTDDDIGAYDAANAGDTVPPRIQVVRALDSDLPRRIRYHYNSVQRDYQPGEQDSPFRPTSIAVNDQDVSIPIAMGDTQALQASEIIWADAWNGRTTISIAIDQEWSALEGGDAIAIPVDGFTERVRIIKDQNSGGVLRKLTCVTDDARSYISAAIAAPSTFQPPKLMLLCPTLMFLMDLPALQDADATAGFYTAISRVWTAGNAFKGTQIYKSVDGGSTYTAQYAQVTESAYGNIQSAVTSSEPFTWDNATIIIVVVPDDSLSFESVSDEAVLAGANAAAMGADGRWEIIQFATATKTAAKTWHLSRLLRGRRGTEHVIGSSASNDLFVMLVSGALARVALNTSEIGNLDDYKSVSIGASFATGTVEPFTSRAIALLPFSPVDIEAAYQTDGDIVISWTRRDKLGRTLMSGVDMPLSEATLAFQVEILDITPDSPDVVIRTIDVTDAQAIYTAAEISADFGSSAPTSLRVAIYQMSAIVGRGTPGKAIIAL